MFVFLERKKKEKNNLTLQSCTLKIVGLFGKVGLGEEYLKLMEL